MSSAREPFDPFLSKLSVPAEGKRHSPIYEIKDQIKDHIKKHTEDCIGEAKTALNSTKKWEERIKDGFAELTRTVDEFLGDDQITTSNRNEELLAIVKRVGANASKVSHSFQSSPTTSTPSWPSEDALKEATNKYEELLAIANRVGADALIVSHSFQSFPTTSTPSSPSEDPLKEAIMHEEDLQLQAGQEISAVDPGMPFLKVSYDDLEPQVKECLLCFSAFPVNRVIKRRVMIYWWIGEGLVAPTRDGRTAEQVGKDYFKMLIATGLIEPIYQKHTKTAKYCKIYTWVWEMLVSKAEEFKIKRTCLVAEKEKDQVEISTESNTNELVSIFNLSVRYLKCDKGKDQLAKLKTVSALILGRWQNSSCHHIEVSDTKFLDGLESLKELRYISMQGISRITELPETIAVLSKLLILDLRLCHNLEKVTPAVTKIISLTHLDVSECYLLDKMPPGMGSLTNLQVLKGFVVGGTRITDPCRLSELTRLKKLRKLSIRIGSEADIGEDLGELSKIKKLKSLKITWGSIKSPPSKSTERKSSRSGTTKETVGRTFSHQNLEKLVLECVPDDNSVSWLKPGGFKELKRLYIAGGKLSQRSLVRENDEWNVEILRLKYLKELKFEWDVLKMKFPRLRCVKIYKCPENGPSDLGFDEKGFWVGNKNKASSSSMGETTDPVRMANEKARSSSMAGTNAPVLMVNEASSSSMAGTSAPVRMRNEAEASSSSLAGTTAPVPIRNEGEASSRSMAGTTAPVPMRKEGEASSGSMAGTTAPVPMRNEGEASSSSMAGTTTPVPLRYEGEASSSSLAGTGAPVPMRNEGEASSSTLAGISAPVPMRNEGEASSSSMAGPSAPVPMRNEGEASSSSMTGTSAPIRMRNEEEASSSSIAAASASVVRDDLDS